MPLTWKDTGFIVGGQHLTKGLIKGFEMIDGYVGKAEAPVQEKPSTWINTLGGLALIVTPRIRRVAPALDYLMTVIGGYMTTKVWDYIEEAMAAGATLRFAPTPTPTPAPAPAPTTETTPTAPETPTATGAKYQVVA
jgi:hypothetical protein